MTYSVTKEIAGLIFDFEGTIVDSMPAHYLSWKEAFSSFGAPFSERFFYDNAAVSFIGVVERYNRQELGALLERERGYRYCRIWDKCRTFYRHVSATAR